MSVWVMVEVVEVGSQDGHTYSILAVHRTVEGADAARARWREEHTKSCGGPQVDEGAEGPEDFDEDHLAAGLNVWVENPWCKCGLGVSLEEVEAEP